MTKNIKNTNTEQDGSTMIIIYIYIYPLQSPDESRNFQNGAWFIFSGGSIPSKAELIH